MGGHLVDGGEEALVGLPGGLGQLHDVGEGAEGGAGLVEADVAVVADAQKLQIHAACRRDLLIVGRGVAGVDAGGDPGAGFVDVDMIEQVVVHEVAVALIVAAVKSHILIQVEAGSILEGDLPCLVEADQLGVEAERGGAGGAAQDGVGLALQQINILLRSHGCDVFGGINDNFHKKTSIIKIEYIIALHRAVCNIFFMACSIRQNIVFPLAMRCNILYYYGQDRRNGGKVDADLLQRGAS